MADRTPRTQVYADAAIEHVYDRPMMVAGVSVPDAAVLELTRRLRDAGLDDAAERLERAYDMQAKIVGLTVPEREAVLRVLEDAADDLAELRAVLVQEHVWRKRQGL
jgi:hypothetical protein